MIAWVFLEENCVTGIHYGFKGKVIVCFIYLFLLKIMRGWDLQYTTVSSWFTCFLCSSLRKYVCICICYFRIIWDLVCFVFPWPWSVTEHQQLVRDGYNFLIFSFCRSWVTLTLVILLYWLPKEYLTIRKFDSYRLALLSVLLVHRKKVIFFIGWNT